MLDIDHIADRCAEALQHHPAGLLTDIDGTISLIAQTPDSATVSDAARSALERLSARLDVTGAITGRAAENAERMVGLPGLVYIGNHGMESRSAGDTVVHPDALESVRHVARAIREVQAEAERESLIDGILYEDKGVTSSVHYRLAPDPVSARIALLHIATDIADRHELKVVEGRMVIELRPRVAINKGTALRSVITAHGIRGLVFLGDDVTDLDAFAALTEMREAGELSGITIAVVAAESNPIVADRADAAVNGVDSCIALLHAIADRLERRQGQTA